MALALSLVVIHHPVVDTNDIVLGSLTDTLLDKTGGEGAKGLAEEGVL